MSDVMTKLPMAEDGWRVRSFRSEEKLAIWLELYVDARRVDDECREVWTALETTNEYEGEQQCFMTLFNAVAMMLNAGFILEDVLEAVQDCDGALPLKWPGYYPIVGVTDTLMFTTDDDRTPGERRYIYWDVDMAIGFLTEEAAAAIADFADEYPVYDVP